MLSPAFKYPRDFAIDFNSHGLEAIKRAIAEKAIPSADSHHVAPFLLFAEGIRQAAITQYFFLESRKAYLCFYVYFSAAHIDFLPLPDALRLLLCRVAFPEKQHYLFTIFSAFADVFCESNQYLDESRDDIRKLAIASVLLSMSIGRSECLPLDQFLNRVEHVHSANEYKVELYESIRQDPIVLYFRRFHFDTYPDPIKRGIMLKNHGFPKKKQFLVLSVYESCLKVFTDQDCTEQSKEIVLYNTITKFVRAKEKEPAKIVIASRDGLKFGQKVKNGLKRPANKPNYVFSKRKDKAELKKWVEYLNFAAQYIRFIHLTTYSPKSC
jgi:hypothetical protein